MKKRLKVAVIMGGRSSEREISLRTGQQVSAALRSLGHEVVELDVTPFLAEELRKAEIDVVYIALHGKYGEDGCIQGFLEILGLPYVGSGVLASALGMDKIMSKRIFMAEGIKTPPYLIWRWSPDQAQQGGKLAARVSSVLGWPVVVKPSREGSTVGVTIVREPETLTAALEEAGKYDRDLLLERYIPGKEITVAVLGNDDPRPLPIIEIVPKKAFYDFEAKYIPGMSEHIIPARLSPAQTLRAEELALRAYRALGCRGFARVDMIAHPEEEEPYVLEVNTLPGMTATSLVPDAARAAGLDFPALVERLIELALQP